MIEIISLTGRIEEIPVVSTGIRWPTLRESKDASDFFSNFPELKNNPAWKEYGSASTFPEPFAKGGGLFPVLLMMDDSRLVCATRTGSVHAGAGGEISLSFSSDRGKSWSDYRVVVQGDPERKLDLRNPAFGQAKNGELVLAYGVMEGIDVHGHISTPDPFRSIEAF